MLAVIDACEQLRLRGVPITVEIPKFICLHVDHKLSVAQKESNTFGLTHIANQPLCLESHTSMVCIY